MPNVDTWKTGCANPQKTTSSVHDFQSDHPPFGSRFLTEGSDVWSQNAWDHVPPPEDQASTIVAALARQHLAPVHEDEKPKYNEKPSRHWDNFYKMNSSNFFRNRKWLHNEFPELTAAAQPEAGQMTIVEIGCGAGNSVFPLLAANRNPNLTLRAYDYSNHAVKLVQANPLYLSPPTGAIHASVWDVTSADRLPDGVEPNSADIVILVFVLSALHPDEWERAIINVYKMLKPGGLVVFRDYGRYDLTQLRFKAGRLLEDNFYIRGDNTRVYFFELDELALLFTGSPAPRSHEMGDDTSIVSETPKYSEITDENLNPDDTINTPRQSSSATLNTSHPTPTGNKDNSNTLSTSSSSGAAPSSIHPKLSSPPNTHTHTPQQPAMFAIEQLGVDRRLLVNRKRQLRMYRVWMQGKFRKSRDLELST